MSRNILFVILVIEITSSISCREKNTEDALKAYTYWAGQSPTDDVKPINGKYFESANWSKEYSVYLELNVSTSWVNQYIKQNKLVRCIDNYSVPIDAPIWFKINKNSVIFIRSEDNFGSVYFEDTVYKKMFIYEMQL